MYKSPFNKQQNLITMHSSPLLPSPPGLYDQTQVSLKEENDSLRWQLDAYRNEVELLRKEQSKASRPDDDHTQTLTNSHSPDAQIQLLQKNMHNMQQVGKLTAPPLVLHRMYVA